MPTFVKATFDVTQEPMQTVSNQKEEMMMYRVVLLLVAAFPTFGASQTLSDAKSLEGNWRMLEYYSSRTEIPNEKLKMMKVRIKENVMVINLGQRKETYTFTLDPKKSPKQINIREGKKSPLPGIYQLKANTLRIAIADKRPTEFTSRKREVTLMVLQREKK